VWILPLLALVIGAVIVFTKMKKLEAAPPPPEAKSEAPEAPVDPYVARVREMLK
jgi:cytochrome c-type biogenesis protein CcmH/NrfF